VEAILPLSPACFWRGFGLSLCCLPRFGVGRVFLRAVPGGGGGVSSRVSLRSVGRYGRCVLPSDTCVVSLLLLLCGRRLCRSVRCIYMVSWVVQIVP